MKPSERIWEIARERTRELKQYGGPSHVTLELRDILAYLDEEDEKANVATIAVQEQLAGGLYGSGPTKERP